MKRLKTIILCIAILFVTYNLSPNTMICKAIPNMEEGQRPITYNVGLRKANGAFRKFKTPQAGYDALVHDIELKQNGKSRVMDSTATIEKFISIYAPRSENNTLKYLHTIIDSLQVPKHTPIQEVNKHSLAKFILMLENKKVFNLLFKTKTEE